MAGRTFAENSVLFLRRVGLNRAVGYGVLTRLWSLAAGPITLLVIASRFSVEQQGFYYTISSLLALQVFFELGLMYVISQFVSHEFVSLAWGAGGQISGDMYSLGRLTALLGKSVKWFAVASALLIVIFIPAGLVFFNLRHAEAGFDWQLPWILAVCGTALNLMAVPFMATVNGSGEVAAVNRREMLGAVTGSVLSWLVIGCGGSLYAVFAVTTGNAVISWYWLLREKPALLSLAWQQLFAAKGSDRIDWWKEVWPMQWKMALSFASSYFMFQLFTPVLFHYRGAVEAGKMGMSLSVSNALLAASASWMSARYPEFGKITARREWGNLDRMFFLSFWQSMFVVITGAVVGWAAVSGLQEWYPRLGQRFIPGKQAALLFGAVCVQIAVNSFATYLRAHKQEPLVVVTVAASIVQGGATWYLGMKYGTLGVTTGFLAVNLLLVLPAVYLIWQRCRREWHMTP